MKAVESENLVAVKVQYTIDVAETFLMVLAQ